MTTSALMTNLAGADPTKIALLHFTTLNRHAAMNSPYCNHVAAFCNDCWWWMQHLCRDVCFASLGFPFAYNASALVCCFFTGGILSYLEGLRFLSLADTCSPVSDCPRAVLLAMPTAVYNTGSTAQEGKSLRHCFGHMCRIKIAIRDLKDGESHDMWLDVDNPKEEVCRSLPLCVCELLYLLAMLGCAVLHTALAGLLDPCTEYCRNA